MAQRFGEKLKQVRELKGLTRTELAKQLKFISRAHIANVEDGREIPSLTVVVRIAEHLGVTIDSLLRDHHEIELVEVGAPAFVSGKEKLLFGERLRILRKDRNMSQSQLAQNLRLVSRANISDLESSHKLPSIDLAIAIADLFGVTTDDILRGAIRHEMLTAD